MVFGYYVSPPNSYLVITGAHIKSLKITKKALVLPFQKVTKISITPFEFSIQLQAMTSEKLKICLPVMFTIGPQDEPKALERYAVLLTGDNDGHIASKGTVPTGRGHVQEIVRGIIEGETRSIISNLTMMELFDKRALYKKSVVENVQSELAQFGLYIYNASIRELQDTDGMQYFAFQSKKAHEGVQNQARVDVATAKMTGDIGEAERQGKTKQEIAKINAQTAILETERKIEKAKADSKFKSQEIEIERGLQIERIAAERASELRDAELQKGVQAQKAQMELERLRATTVTKAKVAKESSQEQADAELYKSSKEAEAKLYQASKDAEAAFVTRKNEADAALYRTQKEAEGFFQKTERQTQAKAIQDTKAAELILYRNQKDAQGLLETKQKEAEATFIMRKNEAAGLTELATAYSALGKAFGGPQGLLQYLMLQNGTYEKLAEANARAIQGLQPKINVWNTGSGGADGAAMDPTAPLRNIFQCLPPLLTTIQDQTGVSPPSWMAKLSDTAEGGHKRADSVHAIEGSHKSKQVNGQ